MAPAIAHFLVGAGLLLCLLAPIVFRYDIDRRVGLWLVPVGGLWGMLPDIHHISPVYHSQLYAIHESPWMDLFALHYLLDRPTIRAMYLESVFGSVLFFTLSVIVYSIAQRYQGELTEPNTPFGRWGATLGTAAIATIYGGVVLSVIVLNMGRYELLAAIVGGDGLVVGWLVLLTGTFALGIGLALCFELLPPNRYRREPRDGLIISSVVSVLAWIGLSIIVPLLLRWRDTAFSVSVFSWRALFALLVFSSSFTLVYTLIRGGLLEESERTRTTPNEEPSRSTDV